MLITSRKDHYRGLVTIKLSKLRELAEKHGKVFTCNCGCSFFREDTKNLNMVRCNSCKVWHKLELHDERLEGILADMDKRFRTRKNVSLSQSLAHQLKITLT